MILLREIKFVSALSCEWWLFFHCFLPNLGGCDIVDGKIPLNLLYDKSNCVREGCDNKDCGTSPWNVLLLTSNISKFGRLDMASGIVPSIWLSVRLIVFNDSRSPISVIKFPDKFVLFKFIASINFLFLSQSIPLKSQRLPDDEKELREIKEFDDEKIMQ